MIGAVSPTPATPHERLDAAMEERRQALGMTWAEVATEAKITVETLRAIRRGNNQPSSLTKRGLERTLRWQSSSIDNILAGHAPTPVVDPNTPQPAIEHTPAPPHPPHEEPSSAITSSLIELIQKANERLDELSEEIKELRRERREERHDDHGRRRKGA